MLAVPQVERRVRRHVQELRVFAAAFDAVVRPRERILRIVCEVLVELLVLLVGDVVLRTRPQRARLVDGLVLVLRDHLALFLIPLFLLHQDRQRNVVRILLDDRLELPRGQQVVLAFAQMQRDRRAARLALDGLDREVAFARALPAHAFRSRQARAAALDRDAVRDDEARIEADAELPDQRRVLLLVAGQPAEELLRARARDRAEVRDGFVTAHADAVVVDRDGARGLVERHADAQVRIVLVERVVRDRLEAQLVGRVGCVRDQFAQEDFLVAVERVDHQMQKLFHLCLKAHGFLCHGWKFPCFVADLTRITDRPRQDAWPAESARRAARAGMAGAVCPRRAAGADGDGSRRFKGSPARGARRRRDSAQGTPPTPDRRSSQR